MNFRFFLRPVLALCVMVALLSCEGIPGEYGNFREGSSGYGYSEGGGYNSYQSRPSYYSNGGGNYYGGSGGYYDSNRYTSRPYCANPYYGGGRQDDHHNHHDRDHDDDRYNRRSSNDSSSRGSRSSSSDNDIRLVKVRDGTRGDIPEGFHSKEWYQQRGISVSQNSYETREGERRGYTGSGSNSKSNSKKKKN